MEEKAFVKVYWIQHDFEVERDLLQTKSKTIFLITRPHQLAENLILIFCFYERIKKA